MTLHKPQLVVICLVSIRLLNKVFIHQAPQKPQEINQVIYYKAIAMSLDVFAVDVLVYFFQSTFTTLACRISACPPWSASSMASRSWPLR